MPSRFRLSIEPLRLEQPDRLQDHLTSHGACSAACRLAQNAPDRSHTRYDMSKCGITGIITPRVQCGIGANGNEKIAHGRSRLVPAGHGYGSIDVSNAC